MNRLISHSIKLALTLSLLSTLEPRSVFAADMADIQAILIGGVAVTDPVNIAQVEVRRVDGTIEPGRAGMHLLAGDDVKTGNGVEVSLVFTRPNTIDRIEVFVLANSRAKIGSVFGYYGAFIVTGWGIFNTETKYVRLGKRGTEFQMQVNRNGDVELSVFRGEVDVEQGEFGPPDAVLEDQFINAAFAVPRPGRATQTKAIIYGLQTVKIEKRKPIPQPRPLQPLEVFSYVEQTNYLYVATMPSRLPTNIRPTTFEASKDPIEDKRRATDALTKARQDAILHPDAKSTQKLGEVYKDFGSGHRSTGEFNKAAKLNPALKNDVNFLISESEAYRLSGNFVESGKRLNKVRQIGTTDARAAGAAKIASGNLAYDKAIASINRDDRAAAAAYLAESKSAFEAAGRSPIGRDDFVVSYNLNNVKAALNKDDPTITASTGLDGTYRGKLKFPAADLSGDATLVITGLRFSLSHCNGMFAGSVVPRERTADGGLYDLVFETRAPVAKLTLQFRTAEGGRVVTNAQIEKHPFSFIQQRAMTGMKCVQVNRVPTHVIWQ